LTRSCEACGPAWLQERSWTAAVLLGCASGGLYWASIPKLDWGVLAWICLIPCMLAAVWLRPRQAMAAAFIGGLVAGVGRCYWIAPTLQLYGNVPAFLAAATTALLIAYMATYWLIFARVCRSLPRASAATPWLAASAWVLLEWGSGWMLTGFPWELLGYTQHDTLWLVQSASVAGVYGLSFLIALGNATLVQLLLKRVSPSRLAALALPPLGLLLALYLWGSQRLERLEAEHDDSLQVGIVQGSIPQNRKWWPGQRAATTAHYVELTRGLRADALDLIVLPETALPFYLDHPTNAPHRRRMEELSREMGTPLLVGSLGGSWETGVYNRAFLFDGEGQLQDYADKVHLVPFGEYLPVPWLFGYLEGLVAESGVFAPGKAHRAIALPATPERLGIFICFESVFPGITRKLVRLGSTLLITMTNDAWFGYTAAPEQHFSMSVLRAVETGRDVVRVANTGISGLIRASGRVPHATRLFETTSLTVAAVPRREITPYVKYGDWIVACSAVLLVLGWAHRTRTTSMEVQQARRAALADLEQYARTPLPLPRPVVLLHGYRTGPECWRTLVEQLHRCSTNAAEQLYAPELSGDLAIPDLVSRLNGELPAKTVDWVGHSMGGLVAVAADAQRRQTEGLILTLASPLRGTWIARTGRWLRFPCRLQLNDMVPGSAFVRRLHDLVAQRREGRLHAWFVPGDPLVPRDSALVPEAIPHVRPYPWSACPLSRHRDLCTDIRVVRDIVALLQNRPRAESGIRKNASEDGRPR
jgi:apolipoprotein N-acyltransferase